MEKRELSSKPEIYNARLVKATEEKGPVDRQSLGESLLKEENDRLRRIQDSKTRNAQKSTSVQRFGGETTNNGLRKSLNNKAVSAKKALAKLKGGDRKAAVKAVRAGSALPTIIALTAIFYFWQFLFAILLLGAYGLGIAYNESWTVTILSLGLGGGIAKYMFGIGLIGTLFFYVFGLLAAGGIFISRKVNVLKSFSLLIIVLGLIACITPFFGLLPWVWIWALYVVKIQLKD